MKIFCMPNVAAVALASILSAICTVSIANTIAPADAVKVLIGKTWAGKNERGSDYWLWHEQGTDSGKFGAKFNSPTKGISTHHGTWKIEGERICWHWPDWNQKQCYVKFDLSGNKLDMTRADGDGHSGTLADGNTEGL